MLANVCWPCVYAEHFWFLQVRGCDSHLSCCTLFSFSIYLCG